MNCSTPSSATPPSSPTPATSQIAQYQPRDATTNPSLILKAALKPDYAPLVDEVLARHRDRPLDERVDRLLVRFGCEILRMAASPPRWMRA